MGKCWGVLWRFFVTAGGIHIIGNRIEIPIVVCRIPVVREVSVEIVDILEQIEEVDCHSSKMQFLGPRNEVIPEYLKLPEWDNMEYMEPDFVIP
ncbi:MAG: hypothetical protein LBF34_02400 [Puniceicoccales bacterium]|nr:hypothetical protein [Puniceicoccales bacterium]